MSIVFEIDLEKLQRSQVWLKWLGDFAAECLKEAQRLSAERIKGGTGQYERSFRFQLRPGSPPLLLFGNTAAHAIYLEEGTEAHQVVPVKKEALRWFSAGEAVFAKRANIPAMAPKNIIKDAVTGAADKLNLNQNQLF